MEDKKQVKGLMAIIVVLGIFMLLAAFLILPDLIEFSEATYQEISYLGKPIGVMVLISAIPFFIVLYETLLICRYILNDEIFSDKPIKALNLISVCCLIITFLFIVILVIFLINQFFTYLLGVIIFLVILSSVLIAIFSRILSFLVKRANILKRENDLTI